MLNDCAIEEKGLLLLCISKWLSIENRAKVSALLHAGHKVREVANLADLAEPSMLSEKAWTMAKVSTDVQAPVERLLSLK